MATQSLNNLKELLLQQQQARIAQTNTSKANVAALDTTDCVNEDQSSIQGLRMVLEQVRSEFTTFTNEQRVVVNELITGYMASARKGADAEQLFNLEKTPEIIDQTFALLTHERAADFIEEIGDLIQVWRAEAQSITEQNESEINEATAIYDSAYEEYESAHRKWQKSSEKNAAARAELQEQINTASKRKEECDAERKALGPRSNELASLLSDRTLSPVQVKNLTAEATSIVDKGEALETEIKSCTDAIAVRTEELKKLTDSAEPTFDPDAYPIPEVNTSAVDTLEKLRLIEMHLTTMSVMPNVITNKQANSHFARSTERLVEIIKMCTKPSGFAALSPEWQASAQKSFEEFCERMTGGKPITRENFADVLANIGKYFTTGEGLYPIQGSLACIFQSPMATQKLNNFYAELVAASRSIASETACEKFANL